MTFIVLVLHVFVDCVFGIAVLRLLGSNSISLFQLAKAVALGFFIETLILGLLHFLGISLVLGFVAFSILTIGLILLTMRRSESKLKWHDPLLEGKLSIWEMGILALISEKIIWSILNLMKLPIYFDDALNHWSGRGKALAGGVNWSWDPDSIYFLGKTFGHMEYPLMISIWRAVNTQLIGSANGASERADGLIIWIIIMLTTATWIYNLTNKRWLGLAGAFVISAIPLETWHMTAGYAEILIQCYLLLALWAMFNNKFILAGIFSAAMIWSKNEGLILFIPCVLFCLCIYLFMDKEKSINEKLKSFGFYNLAWIITIAPWIAFKLTNNVGLTIPGKNELGYVPGALSKISYVMLDSPSSSILWVFLLLGLIISIPRIIKSRTLITLSIGSLSLLLMMIFVFTSTGAYIFLENQMTIHRSLLQIAPLFIITVVIALGQSKENLT